MGNIIDGKFIAAGIRQRLRDELRASGLTPGLGVVLVGDDPASRIYVGRKRAAGVDVGIHVEVIERPASTPQPELLADIAALNARPAIHGIIIQRPLPEHLDALAITSAVAVEKDVDCLHPENVGLLMLGEPRFTPPTPKGIIELLRRSSSGPAGRHVVIVGRGRLVGRPLAVLLSLRGRNGDATVTVCHRATPNLAEVTRTADILVVAIGTPRYMTAEFVRPGAIVVDVGINRIADAVAPNGTRIVGDVDFDAVREIAGAITPVPGGVGPMTVAMLLENVVEATKRNQGGTS